MGSERWTVKCQVCSEVHDVRYSCKGYAPKKREIPNFPCEVCGSTEHNEPSARFVDADCAFCGCPLNEREEQYSACDLCR